MILGDEQFEVMGGDTLCIAPGETVTKLSHLGKSNL